MRTLHRFFCLLLTLTLVVVAGHARAEVPANTPRQQAIVMNALRVLGELREAPDQGVPNWLLERAYAVAVVPDVIKVSLIGGVRRGSGVLTMRQADGSWSNPIFVNLTGGSLGLQWGVQSSDIMLVFVTRASVEGIVGGKVTFGADAAVAAGPVGRQTSASTDVGMNAQVYAYSRSKGLFLGVALDGSAMTISHRDNEAFYAKPGILASEITAPSAAPAPELGMQFIASLNQGLSAAPTTASTPSVAPAAPATTSVTPATTTAPATTTTPASGLVTYPMEDSHPGAEPPK